MKTFSILTAGALLMSYSGLTYADAKADIVEYAKTVKSGRYACEDQFAVLFGNGIMNDHKAATKSKLELQKQVDPELTTDLKEKTVYNNVYNPTEKFFIDIREATGQKTNADERQLLKWLADLSFAPRWFREALEETIEKHDRERILASAVTQSHVNIYNSLLSKGRKIAPVTHSQGNLFINEAYHGIHDPLKQGMGIVSVANPDDVVADMNSTKTGTQEAAINVCINNALTFSPEVAIKG